jgi:sialic acid synthase SpsE
VGLSDHTIGIGVAIASIALGACVIEKHFTLRRADGGVDAAFSLEPHELKSLVEESQRAYQSLGRVNYTISTSEAKSKIFKRSIYAVKDIHQGEQFTVANIKVLRPGFGLAPKHYDTLLRKTAKEFISAGTPLTIDFF